MTNLKTSNLTSSDSGWFFTWQFCFVIWKVNKNIKSYNANHFGASDGGFRKSYKLSGHLTLDNEHCSTDFVNNLFPTKANYIFRWFLISDLVVIYFIASLEVKWLFRNVVESFTWIILYTYYNLRGSLIVSTGLAIPKGSTSCI